jgi:hypothetical protein
MKRKKPLWTVVEAVDIMHARGRVEKALVMLSIGLGGLLRSPATRWFSLASDDMKLTWKNERR